MPILIACSSCKGQCQAPDTAAGRKVRCPKCGAVLDVPAPAVPPQARPAPLPVASPAPVPAPAPRLNAPLPGLIPSGLGRVPRPVWLLAGGAGALLVAVVVIIVLAAGSNSSAPTKDGRAEVRPPITVPDRKGEKGPPTKPAEKETPKEKPPEITKEGPPKDDPGPADKEKLLRDATALQAPPLGLGKASNLSDFAAQMRKLATDEFAFKDAQAKVHQASFDQKSIQRFPATKTEIGRNVIVFPGTYDFGQKRSTWQLHLWYRHHAESKAGDTIFPEDTDACCLLVTFDQDEATARKWKEAFDRGSLRLTIWFRLATVEKRAWKNDPRMLDGTQSHDIAFRAEVLHVEYTTDGTEPVFKAPNRP